MPTQSRGHGTRQSQFCFRLLEWFAPAIWQQSPDSWQEVFESLGCIALRLLHARHFQAPPTKSKKGRPLHPSAWMRTGERGPFKFARGHFCLPWRKPRPLRQIRSLLGGGVPMNGPMREEIEKHGGIKLIYIDPPFDVGADFSMDIEIGDDTFTKQPSVLEELAYRDTWGKGADS